MRLPVLCLLSFAAAAAHADVGLLGVMTNRALLSVDGAAPRMYGVGATLPDGGKLVAVSRGDATIEHNGQRYTVALGQPAARAGSAGKSEKLVLAPDAQGHYVVQGEINSVSARMLIDTGASLIALPGHEAERMGIDFRKGRRVYVSTANGQTVAWRVKLDTLRLGDMELHALDALVHESGLPIILLGNSFLNRFDMRRDGDQMTLQRRY
ncbi:retropepsin-like aspartic protease family protein [Massilia endophytica]|uniref:retropepsin-like aspartic protease family protein n=1 Tax=Massilia endophytica TaxID=2899220 RepID=UPI001E500C0E|nr:TIGR02281 family clan AA aspartic protease [Massilia endophytica]UGQ46673.1 TIGR02281 family clan AA aspartic protease [Massilia endophytica]